MSAQDVGEYITNVLDDDVDDNDDDRKLRLNLHLPLQYKMHGVNVFWGKINEAHSRQTNLTSDYAWVVFVDNQSPHSASSRA